MSMKLELTIETGAGPETVALALTKVARQISDGTESAAIYDTNGNSIGQFLAVNWLDRDSIFRYAQAHNLNVSKSDIREPLDGGEGYTLDNQYAAEWFADMLGD